MTDLLSKIEAKREAILLGEVGALLHMFGKCSSEFLKYHSSEPEGQDSHQDLKHLPRLESHLRNPKLSRVFSFVLAGQDEKLNEDFTDFIKKYSRCSRCNGVNPAQCLRCHGNSPDSSLLWLFNTCHRMTSADEKGVVRKKQLKDNMRVTTPFGYRVQKIDLSAVDAVRKRMDGEMATALGEYLQGQLDIDNLYKQAIGILKDGMSQALGETRKPANDVTLWAQSHGVASLYTPALATLALSLDPCPQKSNGTLDYDNVCWRLFGVGWNGLGFVQRGRRPGDILRRQEILRDIRDEVQHLLEGKYPLGNLFYEDLSGLFFTFPGLHDNKATAEQLVRELAPEVVEIVRGNSDKELWPFFTLSQPRRTLTAITREVSARDQLAAVPRVAALLSIEKDDDQREERLLVGSPILKPPDAGQDVCPVCQFRSKPQQEDACQICRNRRSRRQEVWQSASQHQTMWIDEVADNNNRLALLTLRFDLSRWLSGEWLTTLFSQTFDEWLTSSRMQQVLKNQQQQRRVEQIKNPLEPTADVATAVLRQVGTGQITQDQGFKAIVLRTFFEDVDVSQSTNAPNYIVPFLENLRMRINDASDYRLTAEDLATVIFTQNPSPARLRRIWEATDSFLSALSQAIDADTFAARPQRLRFSIKFQLSWPKPRQTYRITVPGLSPATLTVLCLDRGDHPQFLTVDSLNKFALKTDDLHVRGLSAVQHMLQVGGIQEWRDEETGQKIAGAGSIPGQWIQDFNAEEYLPFIVLTRSPAFCQFLLPAERASKVLRQLLALADQHFGKVQGKLPLHASLLVVNRRFPLYALLEAGQMALDHRSIGEGSSQHPWWDRTAHAVDPFYSFYPMKIPDDGKGHTLADLAPVNQTGPFWMTPGYVDFDFLGSTADRHRLTYEKQAGRLVRPSIAYGNLRPRPFPLHRLQDLFRVWDILVTHLGPTQRHHLEEALVTKLKEWESVGEEEVWPVFVSFGKALLRHTFTEKKWAELCQEQHGLLEQSVQDGLLLEALELFQHVLQEEPSNG